MMAARVSFWGRALLALVLLVGFYVMAIAIAVGMLGLAYLMVAHANRINVKALILCVVVPCIILWSILPRWDKFEAPGPELTPEDQPKLFQELASVADSVGQEMPREVYLVPDVNAWVSQRGGMMGFGGRRVMGLGLPLMQALSRAEFLAVVAHEFGHYHGGDTALGPLIYRTRAAIGRTIAGLGEQGWINLPFRWYGSMFLRLTHAISRQQEYAADALAAETIGARPLVSGLKKVHGAAVAFGPYLEQELAPVLASGFRPPFAEGFSRFLCVGSIAKELEKSVASELAEGKSDPYDTHPPLRDRIAALQSLSGNPTSAVDTPAIALIKNVPALESYLLGSMYGEENVDKLKPTRWENVANDVHLPHWRVLVGEHPKVLKDLVFRDVPKIMADAEAFRAKLGREVGGEVPMGRVYALLSACLVLTLVDRGWSLRGEVGEPFRLTRTDTAEAIVPFAVIGELGEGKLNASEWLSRCQNWGIADSPLQPLDTDLEVIE